MSIIDDGGYDDANNDDDDDANNDVDDDANNGDEDRLDQVEKMASGMMMT